jgi:hypothetical protein
MQFNRRPTIAPVDWDFDVRRFSHGRLARCTLIAATLAWWLVGETSFAVDTTWIFNGDGLWTDAGNWNNGEPVDETFDVFIDDGGTAVTVTLDMSRTIGSLSLGAGDTLTLGNVVLTSANVFANDGSIVLKATPSAYWISGWRRPSLSFHTLDFAPRDLFSV